MEIQQNPNMIYQDRYPGYQDPGRGNSILVLGILSLVLLGPFTGIPAWVMGSKDLKKIRAGLISYSAKSNTQVGMILGIVSTALSALALIGVIMVIAINLILASPSDEKEELTDDPDRAFLISECNMVALHAQQYYNTPIEFDGGQLSFNGFKEYMDQRLTPGVKRPFSGKITLEDIGHESMVIVCTGKNIGEDEVNPMQVKIKVYADKIDPVEIIN